MKNVVGLCSIAVLALTVSACTFKGTTKGTTDATSDVTATTSGKSWFEGGMVKKDQAVNAFAHLNFDGTAPASGSHYPVYFQYVVTPTDSSYNPTGSPTIVPFTLTVYPDS